MGTLSVLRRFPGGIGGTLGIQWRPPTPQSLQESFSPLLLASRGVPSPAIGGSWGPGMWRKVSPWDHASCHLGACPLNSRGESDSREGPGEFPAQRLARSPHDWCLKTPPASWAGPLAGTLELLEAPPLSVIWPLEPRNGDFASAVCALGLLVDSGEWLLSLSQRI